jgi:hypothetical protein
VNKKPQRLCHWIPAYNEQVSVNVVSQVLRDAFSCAENGVSYTFRGGHSCDLVWLRNQALDRAIREGYDWMVQQDADVFSEAAGGPILDLLQTAEETGATVTGALVSMRTDPPRANVWPVHPGEVFEADKIGTGLVLINLNKVREWYDDYQGPCFARTYDTDKGVVQKIGLDVYFCYVVRQHGGLIVCDARIPTVHVNGCHRLRYDGESIPYAAVSADEATRAA